MDLIYTSKMIDASPSLSFWKKDAYSHFQNKLLSKENPFPCIPAAQSFSMQQLRYAFVEDTMGEKHYKDFSDKLKKYTMICRDTGKYASFVVFFNSSEKINTVIAYSRVFWKILNEIKKYDDKPWPGDIPHDPDNSAWEYCYSGEKYFMYCATPKHVNRKSRYFPYFMMAITPRWVLNEFNSNVNLKAKIKDRIRERLTNYDDIAIHPDLNQYGNSENKEWKQYFLSDNQTSPAKCPFSSANDKKTK